MAVSAETQAIIDRLKAEGDLIRNNGTNSIRSVKVQLDRFENVFNTISLNIAEQTKLLQMQAGIAQEAIEAQKTKEQLEEIKTEKKKYNPENDNVTNEKIDKMGDKIESAISSALSFRGALGALKDMAMIGGGLFVGYNLIKGFFDERTNGGFSAMEDSIASVAWPAVTSSFNGMVTAISTIDWEALATAVNTAANAILNVGTWLEENLPGILQTAIIGRIAAATAGGAARGIFSGGGLVGPLDASDRNLISNARRHQIRAGIAGIVTTGLLVFGDDLKNWVNRQEWSDSEIAGVSVGDMAAAGIDAATTIGTFATIGGMFGPTGLLVGAVLGTAWVLGKATYDWIQRNREDARQRFEEELSTMTPETAAESLAAAANGGGMGNLPAGAGAVGGETVAVRMGEIVGAGTGTQAGDFGTQDIFDNLYRSPGSGGFQEALSERMFNIMDMIEDENATEADRNAARAALIDLQSRASQYASDLLAEGAESRFNQMRPVLVGLENDLRANILDEIAEFRSDNSFRTGTRGFMNFGPGQFAILHGTEAVVPFNTAAGRFLDQYFTENWEPKFANAQNLSRIASGGSGGATVVISAPTTVSPVVNNVSGGRSVNQVSVRGGGGGTPGIRSNPYGIPGFAN